MNFLQNIQTFASGEYRRISLFFVIFYAVGLAGLSFQITKPFFTQLVPLALLLGFAGVLLFHKASFDKKTLMTFAFVFLMSFLIEAVGVATGKIFGNYKYGETLGFKIAETPVIIGLNWLFLVYVSSTTAKLISSNSIITILIAPAFMVLYDLVLEQVAPGLGMWTWENNTVPWQNYLAWFLLAFVFHVAFRIMKIETGNKIAPILFAIQFAFFLTLLALNL